MRLTVVKRLCAALLVGGVAVAIPVAAASGHNDHFHHGRGDHGGRGNEGGSQIKHVLLISVDGMHQSDLNWYIANHPDSELAQLASGGAEFTNNHTSDPSDSDPGGTALMTGGDPRATGVYYDVEYSHATDEPAIANGGPTGATCTPGQPATGGDVIYDSPDDAVANVPDFINPANGTFPSFDENGSIYSGPGNVDRDPGAIMSLKFSPTTSLNPQTFPVDPKTCKPITPWDYLRVNTIFQVVHNAGMRTAWSDKHEVYSSFNGPGSNGQSIDDLFSPEIDSQAVMPNGVPYPQDNDWAHIDAATKQYDGYKVQGVINELGGFDHSGTTPEPVPAILGMNFQTVSVAEKVDSPATMTCSPLPVTSSSTCTTGPTELAGYYPGGTTPRPLLASALDYVNNSLAQMVQTIQQDGLASSTAIIITAKHGQSPTDPLLLKRIQDGPIISAINAAWTAQTGDPNNLIVAGTDDDLWQSYLSTKTQAAADFVKHYLWTHDATATLYQNDGVNRGTEQVPHSGLAKIYAGRQAAKFFGVPYSDPDYPDVFGRVQVGVIYMGTTGKIAEHGGDNPGDRDVPLVVYAPGTVRPGSNGRWVETTQVAPTILRLLGLNPNDLQAVQEEGTQVLPGIGG